MRRHPAERWVLYLLAVALPLAALAGCSTAESPSAQLEGACSLESLPELPDVVITSVTHETEPAPHCKVAGVIGTETNFELLLPDDWNGKFVMGGGGGFVGQVINTALIYTPLQTGYATVGTDTGHSGHPITADWAYNNLERLVSFGHQAVHRTAVTSKALIKAYYEQDIARSSPAALHLAHSQPATLYQPDSSCITVAGSGPGRYDA